MFKKIAGLFLAATMIVSAGAITTSAAEVDDDAAVAAEDQSAAVAAEGSSEVGAEGSSEVGAGNEIMFDVKSAGWGNVKTVFCHVWKADGTGTSSGESWPSWQGKAEKCKYDETSGIATYDLSKTGHNFSKSDGKIYCVIFSANTGMQTYNAIMSGNCIGDTLYCTGNSLENPEDSEKTAIEAAWRNNSDCGPEKKITSTGNIVGTAFPEGENDVTMMATYLIAYYADDAKLALTQDLINKLNISPVDVMGAVTDKLNATGNEEKDKIAPAVEKVLSNCTDPTKGGEKVDKGQLSDAKNNGGSKSNGSSNGSSNSSNNGSTSKGSSSVKSGQETTIFFVFGGLMIAAAGVMFLSRKKREE